MACSWLIKGVTNYLLTGMILQVRPLGSRNHLDRLSEAMATVLKETTSAMEDLLKSQQVNTHWLLEKVVPGTPPENETGISPQEKGTMNQKEFKRNINLPKHHLSEDMFVF